MNLHMDIELSRQEFRLELAGAFRSRVTGLFGPSGSGKTTLLNVIAGLDRSARGRLMLNDTVLQDSARGVFVPPHKRRVAVAFQNDRLFPHVSVAGNLEFGRRRLAAPRRTMQTAEVAELLGIGPLLGRRTRGLSGGERQRVALGRALLAEPELLLLDEPLASLDVALRYQILPVLRRVRDACDVPILIVSHDLSELLELTDQLAVIAGGKLLGQGSFVDLARGEQTHSLMHEVGLPNLLSVRVVKNRRREGISLCRLIGPGEGQAELPTLHLPLVDAPEGAEIRALCRADEIALSAAPVEGVSMQNQLRGQVEAMTEVASRSVCLVDVGCQLLVEITPRSARLLGLAPGSEVWCLFKTQSIRPLSN
ncbi:MAG: molybdenum ABC transporter ATP-binding protein [Phycisphaerae bacterium]